MEHIIRYSGLLAILFAWTSVVLPGLLSGFDKKKETLTYTADRNKNYGNIIRIGLIVGNIFQSIFLFYILRKFSISLFSLGSLVYTSSLIATFLAAIFIKGKKNKPHDYSVLYYFVVNPLALLFIGITLKNTYYNLFIASLIIPCVYFVGEIFLLLKYKKPNTIMEQLAFFLLTVWTLLATFI